MLFPNVFVMSALLLIMLVGVPLIVFQIELVGWGLVLVLRLVCFCLDLDFFCFLGSDEVCGTLEKIEFCYI